MRESDRFRGIVSQSSQRTFQDSEKISGVQVEPASDDVMLIDDSARMSNHEE